MRNIAFVCLLCIWFTGGYAQNASAVDPKYPVQQLKQDLAYLKKQLLNAHADPYSELSRQQYDQLFNSIDVQLTDSATATTFYRLIKPVVAHLSDEHAQVSLMRSFQTKVYQGQNIFLPIALSKKGNNYVVSKVLADGAALQPGDVIVRVNRVAVTDLIPRCALYTTGFPDQRLRKAAEQFGYLYSIANPQQLQVFDIETSSGKIKQIKGVDFNTWQNFIMAAAGQTEPYTKMISYTRYNNAGYINARSFSTQSNAQFDSVRNEIRSIFKQIKADGIKYLFVDVSKNSGGNSSVGNVLINYFHDKSYKTYQCNWRRSDEYLAQMKAWGNTDDNYSQKAAGTLLHFDSGMEEPDTDNPYRFKGDVYVIVGDGTFSSAIMFATVIKDNHIANLIGLPPADGHPDHFGELYSITLPNTPITVRFGVKEWIRPAGKTPDNVLHPDKIIDLNKLNTPQQIISSVVK